MAEEKMVELKHIQHEHKEELLKMSEISLWLDHYDDIFSDFDPRPYKDRALSDDFLIEAKKASRDKGMETIELKLLLPSGKRDFYKENIIKKRLREHFRKHFVMLEKEVKEVVKKGFLFTVLGFVLMIITTFILFKTTEKSILTAFLITLLEPAGWFLFWEGSNIVFFESKEKKPDLEFYRKMAKCELTFLSY